MFGTRKFAAGAWLLVLAGMITGCGDTATAPDLSRDAAVDTLAGGPPPSGPAPFDRLRGLVLRTSSLPGPTGTTLSNGRWRVAVPPRAIEGDAEIAIGVSSPVSGECELEIFPESKNKFDVPVTLTVDCSGLPDLHLKSAVIYWFDPEARNWVEVPGSSVDLANRTVSAPLDHFSRYSVGPAGGKAGW